MKNRLKSAVIATLLAIPLVASAQSFTFTNTGQNPPEARPKATHKAQSTQPDAPKKIRCGEGDAANAPAKFFVSYIEHSMRGVDFGKVYVCGRDDSLDSEEGMREIISRVENFIGWSIAPMMITRVKN